MTPVGVAMAMVLYAGLRYIFERSGRMADPYRTDNRMLDFVNDLADADLPKLMRMVADRLEQRKPGPLLLTPVELTMVKCGDKIGAIREVRARTGLGLKEAKDLVDQHQAPRVSY